MAIQLTAIVDFDETLLLRDSLLHIITRERLYLQPKIFFLGGILFTAKYLLPREKQVPFRTRFKHAVLRALIARGQDQIIKKYTHQLAPLLNRDLLDHLKKNYTKVLIFSAAWEPFIAQYLRQNAPELVDGIYATEFSDAISEFSICWYTQKLKGLDELKVGPFDLFTDSLDDAPLIARATKSFLVKGNAWKQLY